MYCEKSAMTEECAVCMDDKKLIRCPYCPAATCRKCLSRYLVESTDSAHCMGCKAKWGYRDMISLFSKGWLADTKKGGYRNSRQQLLLEREKAMIPQTLGTVIPQLQEEMEKEKKVAALYQEDLERQQQILTKRIELNNATVQLLETTDPEQLSKLEKLRLELFNEVKVLQKSVGKAREPYSSIADLYREAFLSRTVKRGQVLTEFACPCPAENCRGLVRQKDRACTICSARVCLQCRCLLEDEHQCEPDTRKSVAALARMSRPCPKCAVSISKVSGCDQMFCTNCKCLFSWNSGAVLRQTQIHNPHAQEWIREHGGSLNSEHREYCGGLPDYQTISEFSRPLSAIQERTLHNIWTSLLDHSLLNVRGRAPDRLQYDIFRAEYLLGRIDERKWKQKIFRLERKQQRYSAILDTQNLYLNLGSERFRALIDREMSYEKFEDEMRDLAQLINKIMADELAEYGNVYPFIGETFRWTTKHQN